MPTYTYKCDNCGYQFDLFHSISDIGEKICPQCDKPARRFFGECAGFNVKGGVLSTAPMPSSVPSPFT